MVNFMLQAPGHESFGLNNNGQALFIERTYANFGSALDTGRKARDRETSFIFAQRPRFCLDGRINDDKLTLVGMMPKFFNLIVGPLAALFFIGMFLPRSTSRSADSSRQHPEKQTDDLFAAEHAADKTEGKRERHQTADERSTLARDTVSGHFVTEETPDPDGKSFAISPKSHERSRLVPP